MRTRGSVTRVNVIDTETLRATHVLFVLLAAGSAVLALAHGGYFPTGWGTAASAALLLFAGLVGAGLVPRVRVPLRARVALSALGTLLLLTCSSIFWAADRQGAVEETGRTLLYATLVLLGSVLAMRRSSARALLIAAALVPGIVAVVELWRMAAGNVRGFEEGRLLGMLGYQNGLASLLTSACWTAVVLAAGRDARARVVVPLVTGSALALQVAVLTQSRAMVATFVLTGVFALFRTPQRLRVLVLGAAICSGVVGNWRVLNAVYAGARDVPVGADVDGLVLRIVLGAVPAAVVAGVACHRGHRERHPRRHALVPIAIAALVLVLGAVGVVRAQPDVQHAWASFTSEPTGDSNAGSRFEMVSNNGRIVMWTTALETFAAHPLVGVGGGNWEASYYRLRARDVGFARQPHGLTVELLAERGVLGTACVLLVLALAFAPALRRIDDARDRTCVIAATSLLLSWLLHAQVDWLWQLPAVTAGPMLALGVLLVAPWTSGARPALRLGTRAVVVTASLLLTLAAALPAISYRFVERAREHPSDATQLLAAADRVLPVSARIAGARALDAAAHGDRRHALELADVAIRRNPEHYATWAMAADASREVGATERADRFATRARELDPHRRA